MIAKIFRLIVVTSFYTLAVLWCYAYSHSIKYPGESVTLLLLLFTSPVSIVAAGAFILVLDRDAKRPSWYPDHPIFAGTALVLLILIFFVSTPPQNPWGQYGVKIDRIQGGSSLASIFFELEIDHLGTTVTHVIPGGLRSDWHYDCRDLNSDGIQEIIVEDSEGRSVTTFIPAHEDQAPKFQTLEWTWKY